VRLLVIDDEPQTNAYLRKGLEESGFVVDTACNGVDGLHLALHHDFDLVVLDVALPDLDGWTVLKTLRAHKATPVLFLSACADLASRVRGIEMGGDDYLAKPFAFAELVVRIRGLLRRVPTLQPEILTIADLEINVAKRRVRRAGVRINLTPREFSLLHLLARKQGEVIALTDIASRVWNINFDSETNIVAVAIRRLRVKIDDPFPRKLIQTVRGAGYILDDCPL
jgi:two-component system copper resistance phosphate regulon response regulator CusR